MLFLITPTLGATTLSGVKLMGNYTSNDTISFPMKLSTSSSDSQITYQLSVMDFGNSPNGGYIALEPENRSYSAQPYISLDKSEVTILPGQSETIIATIKLQSSSGGLYSLINIHPKVTSSNGTSVVTAMNIPIMITINNNSQIKTGEITKISIDPSNTISTTFTNTGNTHYYNAKNIIGINISGKEEYISTKPLITAIVPGGTVIFSQHINGSLSSGIITSYIITDDDKVLAINTTTLNLSNSPQITLQQTPIKTSTTKSPISIEIIIISLISLIFLTNQKYI